MDEQSDFNVEDTELPSLNAKQRAFVHEYLIDLNATQAAIRAGYSSRSASSIGEELLRKPEIEVHVERGKAQRLSRVGVKADDVLHEMSLLANSRIDHYYVDDDGQVRLVDGAPEGAMAAVQSIKRRKTVRETRDGDIIVTYDVEIRLWDKPNPLKLMGRHAGIFADRVEHTGKDGGPIEVTEVKRTIIDPKEE